MYRHYGRDVIRSILRSAGESVSDKDLEVLYKKMYLGFVEHVDGIDNGINAFTGERNYKVTTTLSDRVATLNPAWNEGEAWRRGPLCSRDLFPSVIISSGLTSCSVFSRR